MFESLQENLKSALTTLQGKGKLTDANMRDGLRLVEQSLLEADVSYPVVQVALVNVVTKPPGPHETRLFGTYPASNLGSCTGQFVHRPCQFHLHPRLRGAGASGEYLEYHVTPITDTDSEYVLQVECLRCGEHVPKEYFLPEFFDLPFSQQVAGVRTTLLCNDANDIISRGIGKCIEFRQVTLLLTGVKSLDQ